MKKSLIHTPEGTRDIFARECDKKRYLERKIEKKFRSYGYQSIETPSFEFEKVYSEEVGTIPTNHLFRFFDRDGSMLALRPDFTPSVARAVSMYFAEEEGPLRLCYEGSVFQNHFGYQGRLRESTQMGVEFLNENSAEADAEVLALVASVMNVSGLPDFQISLGHVAFFQSLAEEAGLDPDTLAELKHLLTVQNRFGADKLIDGLNLRKDLREAFHQIPDLRGGPEVLERAKKLTENPEAQAACDRLLRIHEILKAYQVERYVTYDLSMLTEYRYYTGIIFQAYTYGTGDAIIKGGRYDRLLEHFGKKSAAVGFTTEVDSLLSAIERQNVRIPIADVKTMVLYPVQMEAQAIAFARENREDGLDVACVRFEDGRILDDYTKYGIRNQFGGIVYFKSPTEAYAINLGDGTVNPLEL